jgi:aspartyl-tRNA(Asn)/glutamyl-tRNA(Gln) amidotransferase subunit C
MGDAFGKEIPGIDSIMHRSGVYATFAHLLKISQSEVGVPMALEAQEVERIAHLARLGIEPDDIPEYARNLSDILAFVEQLNSADTRGVEPLAHPLDASQRLRPDVVTETDERENFLSNAPLTEAGLYLVPKVIE